MLATLIPLFDENMTVKAYSLFTQKKNFLLNPSFLGTGMNDGVGQIQGFELIEKYGNRDPFRRQGSIYFHK